MLYFIYVLVDPRTDIPGYIGITNPNARLSQHFLTEGSNKNKDKWIDQLYREGLKSQMKTVEIVEDEQEVKNKEKELILKYVEQCVQVTNM